MIQQIFASQSVTADTTPGIINIPPGLGSDEIALTVKHGYGIDLVFSTDEAGTKAVYVPDDTASPDNYTFFQGPTREAPIYVTAASSTPITIMIFEVR